MSIVQDEKELEYWSDQKLLEEAQTPTGRMPLFLIHTQIEKRKNYRDSANARKQTPTTSIYEEDVAEFGGGGLGSMQQQMPMSPSPNQQMPMSAPPPQAGMGVAPMARGGLIRAEEGVHLPRKDLPTLMGDYRGTGRGNLTRKQQEELEKKIRAYKSNLKLSPFENVRKVRNMSGGGVIRAQNSAYIDPRIGNVLGVPTQDELKKQQEQIKEIQRQIALARKGEGGIPWGGIGKGALGLAMMLPWTKKGKQAWDIGKKSYQGAKAGIQKFAGRRAARKDPTKLLRKPAGSTYQPMPTTIAGGPKVYEALGSQALKDINKLQLLGKGAKYGTAAYLGGTGAYEIGKSLSGKGGKTDQQVIDEVLKGLSKEDSKPTVGLPSITDSQSAEPEYRRFYSEYMQPEEEFQAELTDVESYRTTPEQRKNEATALAYSGLASALSNVGMENIIKGISEITPEVIALRKMQTEEQRVVDKNEADLRKGRRADRLMAINMQLEWEKMQNLRSSYEAAGKMEILKAAWEAFSQQMPSKDMRSLDDFLYFFEVGEFPDKNLSPADAVAAAGQ
jgi:hypothetical protein